MDVVGDGVGRFKTGDRVAVDTNSIGNAPIFGVGPIGMLMALSILIRGVADITMADIDDLRLELAASFGVITVNAAGDLSSLQQSMAIARRRWGRSQRSVN